MGEAHDIFQDIRHLLDARPPSSATDVRCQDDVVHLQKWVIDRDRLLQKDIQTRARELMNDLSELENILKQGADAVRPTAAATLQRIKDVVGLG